jgi:hypothetical protein
LRDGVAMFSTSLREELTPVPFKHRQPELQSIEDG